MLKDKTRTGNDPRQRDQDVGQFIDCVYFSREPSDIVEVRCLRKRGETTETKQFWRQASRLVDLLDKLSELNRDGWNIYVGANPRPRTKATGDKCITIARTLFVDFDGGCTPGEADTRRIQAGLPEPTLTVFSGHGVHCYWLLVEPHCDLRKWSAIQKRLISALDSDRSIHNPERIMRLPGFSNVKSEPHVRCYVVEADPTRVYELANIEAALSTPASSNGHGEPEYTTTDTSDVVNNARQYISKIPNVGKGERNAQAYKVAAVLVNDFALGESDAMMLLAEWNAGNGSPLDSAELVQVLKSGGKYAQKPHGCKAESTATAKKKKPAPSIEPYRSFPVEALPEVVQRFVIEAARAIGCDTSFIGVPMLGCLARAIGNKRVIRLKKTWDESPIIWAAIVGKSGTHKTPAVKATMATLQRKQAEAIEAHQEALKKYAEEMAAYDRDYAAWKRSKTTEPPPWEPVEPVCQRFIVGDITIEALADRLAGQYDGVLVVRDELAGWINGIAEYKGGKGSDTGHWLATWSGEPLTVDRKTGAKKMLHVPRAAVSIIGGIQPGILRQAIGREHMQDGLCARLLLTMPESTPVQWTDAVIDGGTYQAMNTLLERLLTLDPAADADGRPEPFPLALSTAAVSEWVAYYNRHRHEQADLSDDLAAAWSKLEAYTARFALIFQLCRNPDSQNVDDLSIKSAIALSEWFGREAKRVYGTFAEDDDDREQRELAEWIRRRGGVVSVRDVQQGRRECRTADDAEALLMALVEAGHGTWRTDTHDGGRGRPVRLFQLSTSVYTNRNTENHNENANCVDVDSVDAPESEEAEWIG